jgi:hypothetical protein
MKESGLSVSWSQALTTQPVPSSVILLLSSGWRLRIVSSSLLGSSLMILTRP